MGYVGTFAAGALSVLIVLGFCDKTLKMLRISSIPALFLLLSMVIFTLAPGILPENDIYSVIFGAVCGLFSAIFSKKAWIGLLFSTFSIIITDILGYFLDSESVLLGAGLQLDALFVSLLIFMVVFSCKIKSFDVEYMA